MVLVAGPLALLSQCVQEAASALRDLALLMAREWEGRAGSLLRPVQLPLPEPGAVPQPSRSTVTITLLKCFSSNHWGWFYS